MSLESLLPPSALRLAHFHLRINADPCMLLRADSSRTILCLTVTILEVLSPLKVWCRSQIPVGRSLVPHRSF